MTSETSNLLVKASGYGLLMHELIILKLVGLFKESFFKHESYFLSFLSWRKSIQRLKTQERISTDLLQDEWNRSRLRLALIVLKLSALPVRAMITISTMHWSPIYVRMRTTHMYLSWAKTNLIHPLVLYLFKFSEKSLGKLFSLFPFAFFLMFSSFQSCPKLLMGWRLSYTLKCFFESSSDYSSDSMSFS